MREGFVQQMISLESLSLRPKTSSHHVKMTTDLKENKVQDLIPLSYKQWLSSANILAIDLNYKLC